MTVKRQRGRRLQERRALFLRSHPLCCKCQAAGRLRVATEVDHIVALINGGADDFETNGQPLCTTCHKEKTAIDLGYRSRPTIGVDGYPTLGDWAA